MALLELPQEINYSSNNWLNELWIQFN
jgi:hypothetical protein